MPMEILQPSLPTFVAGGNPLALQGTPVVVADGTRFKSVRRPGRRSRRLSAADLYNRPWLITRDGLESLIADYTQMAALTAINAAPWDDDDDDDDDDPNKNCPYGLTDDGMACLLIAGPLSRNASWYTTAYSEIAAAHAHALANPNVKGICACFHSPGGEASSDLFDLADAMFDARGDKPCVGIAYDQSYSASYCLMAACSDKIFVTRCGGVGSVGCWTAHTDVSEALEQHGIRVTLVFSGDQKVDGNPYEKLSDRARASIQADVDRIRAIFAASVAKGRACPVSTIMDTEAALYHADDACPTMADMVGSMDDALNYLRGMVATKQLEEPGDNEDYPTDPDGSGNAVPPQANGSSAAIASRAVSLGTSYTGPIPYSKTATTDAAWDAGANVKNLKSDQPASYYRKMFAWVDSAADGTKKGSFKYPHHMCSADGTIGAANTNACRAIIANLNGARSSPSIPSGDRKGVYNHASGHLKAAGLEPAPLKSEKELAADSGTPLLLEMVENDELICYSDSYSLEGDKLFRVAGLLAGLSGLRPAFPEAIAAVRHFRSVSYAATSTVIHAGTPTTDSREIEILCAPYSSAAHLGQFDERYRPGCFDGGLSGDLRVLARHAESQNFVLGRVSAGTAKFWTDKDGVHAQATAPDTTWANDLLVSMRRGDVSDASTAFYILKQSWETDPQTNRKTRWVERGLIVDASVEAFGAYPGATSRVADASLDAQASALDAQASAAAYFAAGAAPVATDPQVSAPVHDLSSDHNRTNRARLDILRLYD